MAPDTSADLGRILSVWAHPDDETWTCGALMAAAVDAGRRVVCVTATRGEAGFPAEDPRSAADRAALREAELAASLALLGVTEHHWLGYPDGGCSAVPDREPVATLTAMIDDLRPDTVLTFGPDGGTGHPDHVAACRWVTAAVAATNPARRPELLYATKSTPWMDRFMAGIDPSMIMMVEGMLPESVPAEDLAVWFSCDDEAVKRKVAALRAQVSQIEPLVAMWGEDVFRELNREEFFRRPRPGDGELLSRMTERGRAVSPPAPPRAADGPGG